MFSFQGYTRTVNFSFGLVPTIFCLCAMKVHNMLREVLDEDDKESRLNVSQRRGVLSGGVKI